MNQVHVPASSGPRVADNELLLSVRNVRTRFGSGTAAAMAVDDVNFDLRRCERLGVVGESGSGKSVLAKSLMRLVEQPGVVESGSVELEGRALHALTDREWNTVRGNDIALVFQDPMGGFDPLRPVGRQLVEAIQLHRDVSRRAARARVVEALAEVEIQNPDRKFDDYPHQFSGGMLQRASIAMALINEPKIIIADEPTTALDVTTQATVLRLIRRLSDEHGTAVILISHDMGVIAQMCDTVQVMYAGRIIERGPAMEVLVHPRHRYTEALLKSIVRRDIQMSGELPAIPGTPPDLRDLPPGCPFEQRCPVGQGNEKCRTVRPHGEGHRSESGTVTVKCHYPATYDRLPQEAVR